MNFNGPYHLKRFYDFVITHKGSFCKVSITEASPSPTTLLQEGPTVNFHRHHLESDFHPYFTKKLQTQ